MTIAEQEIVVRHVVSDATDYAIPFAYWGEQDLEVWHHPASSPERLLRAGSDYDLLAPTLSHWGGSLRLRQPLTGKGRLVIRRETRRIQGFSAPPNARSFEHALDRVMMILQEQDRNLTETAAAIRMELRAEIAALRAKHAADITALRAEMLGLLARTLRTPEPLPQLPAARERVSRALTFDAAGRPRLVDFYAVNPFLPIGPAPTWTPDALIGPAPVWTPDLGVQAPRHIMIGGLCS